jgi:hypothetical protein
MTITSYILTAIGGYVLCIFTWPYIRSTVIGVEAEAAQLRARASAIVAAARGK